MQHLTPMSSATAIAFMHVYRELCPTINDEAPLAAFAARLGWSPERTEIVALWLDERRLIDTDRGLGCGIRTIEGR